jgi:hypothetical protein
MRSPFVIAIAECRAILPRLDPSHSSCIQHFVCAIPDCCQHGDIRLDRGIAFRAKVVDSVTSEPVDGVRLSNWSHPGVEGRSGPDGGVEIDSLSAGPFEFRVKADGFVRAWSDQASNEPGRRRIVGRPGKWQLNFHDIDFELTPDMKPVTIFVERGVRATGRVIDPDGKPVAGASVSLVLTGTGSPAVNVTLFVTRSNDDGSFELLLPASGEVSYNLMAHVKRVAVDELNSSTVNRKVSRFGHVVDKAWKSRHGEPL